MKLTRCQWRPGPVARLNISIAGPADQSGGIIARIALVLALFAIAALIALAVLLSFSDPPRLLGGLNSLPHEREVMAASEKYGIDPSLVFAIISAESGGQSNACSPAGARGLMQLMPETADWCAGQMGLENFATQQLDDPAVNIDMGCWYLKHLYGEFDGNETAVIAAYNAGMTNVQGWLSSGTWDGSAARLDQVPYSETRKYVQTVRDNRSYFQKLFAQNKSQP